MLKVNDTLPSFPRISMQIDMNNFACAIAPADYESEADLYSSIIVHDLSI